LAQLAREAGRTMIHLRIVSPADRTPAVLQQLEAIDVVTAIVHLPRASCRPDREATGPHRAQPAHGAPTAMTNRQLCLRMNRCIAFSPSFRSTTL
jgi:hypothetical protein